MMEEKKLVPKRRFSGFEEEWEKNNFGSLYDVISGHAFKVSEYVSEGIPIINGESIQNGEIKSGNLNFLRESYLEKYRSIQLKTNDIVLGLNRPIINNQLKISMIPSQLNNSLLYQRAGKILNLTDIHNYFSYKLLEKEIVKFVKEEAVGSDQPFISTTSLRKTIITLPKKQLEQQKIGKFFNVLDERIANQERKIAKVKALKEAYLTEMFPQEGETVPKRRFEGFDETWKEKRLDEIGEILTGSTPSTANSLYYNKDGVPWVTPTDINQNFTLRTAKHLSEKGQKVAQIVPPNTILITCIASIGKNTILGTKGSFNQQINGLIPNLKRNYPYFLYTASYLWSIRLANIAATGTMQIINKTDFSSFKTLIPCLKEQQKIGKFFKNLDDQIATEESKLEKLKKMKEAYLEEMFV